MPSLSTTPSRAAPPPGRGESYWALAASTVLHLAGIAALGLILLPTTPSRPRVLLDSSFATGDDAPPPLEPVRFDSPALTGDAPGGSPGALTLPRQRTRLPKLFDVRAPLFAGRADTPLDLVADVPAGPARGGGGTGEGLGGGVGSGVGAGTGAAFFATDKPTGNYVFVVDCSRSMNHPYPGPAKSRLGRVKVEIWRTIYQMSPEQKYFVVFFNTRAIPMPADRMIAGGPDDQAAYLQWTAQVRADGETDPREALLLAVRMRPDVIYFLTDGEFNYRVVREASEANFGGVQIHTISLGDDAGGRFLQEIADRNQGRYRHIVQDEDRYWEGAAELPGTSAVTTRAATSR
jgi:hypothetical protein